MTIYQDEIICLQNHSKQKGKGVGEFTGTNPVFPCPSHTWNQRRLIDAYLSYFLQIL